MYITYIKLISIYLKFYEFGLNDYIIRYTSKHISCVIEIIVRNKWISKILNFDNLLMRSTENL